MTDRPEGLAAFRDRRLIDRTGTKIGRIADVYVDPWTKRPDWVLVHTGLFGTRPTLVPIRDASLCGAAVSVPFSKAVVEGAPALDPGELLSLESARAMSAYYGIAVRKQ